MAVEDIDARRPAEIDLPTAIATGVGWQVPNCFHMAGRPCSWAHKQPDRRPQARRPNKSKQNQITPNKSKQNCLVLFGFIRPNRDFSMGYNESK
jgi:hypothetical protein